MQFDTLPKWAQTAILSGPIFGSEDPVVTPPPATVTDPPPDKPEADKPEVTVSPEDALKAIRERDAAKLELTALQAEKAEREEAEAQALAATRSKEENQAKQIEDLTEEVKLLSTVNQTNLIDLAIFRNEKYSWQNPNIISKLIDMTDVKVDPKTGKVEGVDDALKLLAKEQPFLLKGKEDANDAGGSGAAITPGQPSGGTPVSSADASAKANKRKAVVDRFPVLRV